jgi:6-phosphogluconolactonase/glucosamine-6-phosphate isomerase/deaminase
VGPLNYDGHWRILWVRERSVADRSDESVRNIAQRALVDEAVDGAAKGHVKWHGPL